MKTTPESSNRFGAGALVGFIAGVAATGAATVALGELDLRMPSSISSREAIGIEPSDYERFFRSIDEPVNYYGVVNQPSPLFVQDRVFMPDRDPSLPSGEGGYTMPYREFYLFAPKYGLVSGRNVGPNERYVEPLDQLEFDCPEQVKLVFKCPEHVQIEQVEKQLTAVSEVGKILSRAGIECFGAWEIGVEDHPSHISFRFPHGDTIRDAEVRLSLESDNPLQLTPYIRIGAEEFTPQALAEISQFMIQKERETLDGLRDGRDGLRRYSASSLFCEWHLGVEQRSHALILVQNTLQYIGRGESRGVLASVFQGPESSKPQRFEEGRELRVHPSQNYVAGQHFTPHLVTDFRVEAAAPDHFTVVFKRGDFPGMDIHFQITHLPQGEMFVYSPIENPEHNRGYSDPTQSGVITPLQPLKTKKH